MRNSIRFLLLTFVYALAAVGQSFSAYARASFVSRRGAGGHAWTRRVPGSRSMGYSPRASAPDNSDGELPDISWVLVPMSNCVGNRRSPLRFFPGQPTPGLDDSAGETKLTWHYSLRTNRDQVARLATESPSVSQAATYHNQERP